MIRSMAAWARSWNKPSSIRAVSASFPARLRGVTALLATAILVAGAAACGHDDGAGTSLARAKGRFVDSCTEGKARDRGLCRCVVDELIARDAYDARRLDDGRDAVESGRRPAAIVRAAEACARRA